MRKESSLDEGKAPCDKPIDLLAELRSTSIKEHGVIDLLGIAAFFLVITPLLSTHRVTDFMIFCIFAMSFDLLYGYMGRLSFGHMLYLGAGAYFCGLFIRYISGNPILAILVGIVVAGILGM